MNSSRGRSLQDKTLLGLLSSGILKHHRTNASLWNMLLESLLDWFFSRFYLEVKAGVTSIISLGSMIDNHIEVVGNMVEHSSSNICNSQVKLIHSKTSLLIKITTINTSHSSNNLKIMV
jgi:hypothetical protein